MLLHFTLKRAPKQMREDLFGLTRISRHSNSASHILKIRWREVTDGGPPKWCNQHTTVYSYVYRTPNSAWFYIVNHAVNETNIYGDNTPPCRTPHDKLKNAENLLHHFTHVTLTANHRSKMDSILFGMRRSINLINRLWWFICQTPLINPINIRWQYCHNEHSNQL